MSRTTGGTTTQFLSSGSQVYLEAVGNTVTAQYAYGNALIRKDSEYPLFDGLGSERTVTNASQTVTGTVNFDAFGNTVGTSGSSSSPYMYAATSGYRNDGDAGLMHVGARYYDAQVGRWTSRDTVLTEHPYLYCTHQPVSKADPSGHEPRHGPPPGGLLWEDDPAEDAGYAIGPAWGYIGLGILAAVVAYDSYMQAMEAEGALYEQRAKASRDAAWWRKQRYLREHGAR